MIRDASAADLAVVASLERRCLGEDAWSEGLIREGVEGRLPTVRYLVAETDGGVVGHAVVSCAGDVAELQRIAVDPAHRRGGVATELLTAAVALAGSSGAVRLLLEVREDNSAARAFYAARGLAELARRTRYYRDGAGAVVMELPVAGAGGTGVVDEEG